MMLDYYHQNQKLQKIIDQSIDGLKIFGASFAIRKGKDTWRGCAGNLTNDQPFFIASTTKLFTTTLIF